MARVLVVDDEARIRSFLKRALEMDGNDVADADSGEAAIQALKQQSFDVVMTDLKMPGITGLEVLGYVVEHQPEAQVIVLTAYASVETAVTAMKMGAYDYLEKPVKGIEQVQHMVARAAERKSLHLVRERESRTRESVERPLTHGDPAMVEPVRALEKVAATDATVLLLGESGTGKEVAARQLHQWSRRSEGPFVAINCAAVSANLLESELFGHEKGAFTSADKRRIGRLELAEGGTFFLDEVGELSLELQAKLLRVLETKEYERVGGSVTLEARVRWVAATNRDLAACVAEGTFRNDLFHRLAVFPVHLPALRERPKDILPIAALLLEGIGADLGKHGLTLSDDATRFVQTRSWPGNVRELRNALERAAILADGTSIREQDLTWADRTSGAQVRLADQLISMEDYERSAIETALEVCGGSRREAAKRLQIAERTLYDKLKRFGLS